MAHELLPSSSKDFRTRGPTLPRELDSLLAWIACIADAQPVDTYADYLRSAAFELEKVGLHGEALTEMVQQIRMKLLSAEVLVGLKKLALPNVDFTSAKQMSKVRSPRFGKVSSATLF